MPCPASQLVAQRPPMLLAGELLQRDRPNNHGLVSATVPDAGVFAVGAGRVIPEYYVELVAQAMAAVNGFDALSDGIASRKGLLVGIDAFCWLADARAGEKLTVEVVKTFVFGPVTTAAGKVFNSRGDVIATGELKAWEQ